MTTCIFLPHVSANRRSFDSYQRIEVVSHHSIVFKCMKRSRFEHKQNLIKSKTHTQRDRKSNNRNADYFDCCWIRIHRKDFVFYYQHVLFAIIHNILHNNMAGMLALSWICLQLRMEQHLKKKKPYLTKSLVLPRFFHSSLVNRNWRSCDVASEEIGVRTTNGIQIFELKSILHYFGLNPSSFFSTFVSSSF